MEEKRGKGQEKVTGKERGEEGREGFTCDKDKGKIEERGRKGMKYLA